MKVLALAILLASVYYIEGAVVKREAGDEEPVATAAPDIHRLFSQYMPNLKESFTEARTFLESLFGEDMRERVTQAFNRMVDSAKKAIQ